MTCKTVLTIGLLIIAADCHAGDLEKLFGKGGARDVIAEPEKVQAYRLAEESFYQPTVNDYETIAGPVAVKGELAKATSKLLLADDSYLREVGKGCEPIYGVRMEFMQGKKKADVFFCFGCDILTVYFQGKPVGSEDFDKIRPQLVKIAKQIFPGDEAIQGLKENR